MIAQHKRSKLIHAVWYNSKTGKYGKGSCTPEELTPGAVLSFDGHYQFKIAYYNDKNKVALFLLKEGQGG